MNCIAHRGFAGDCAENTVGALVAAARVADCVEFDVRRCGSGEVVVIHDAAVDRVTDGTGRVRDLSREALADLDVLGSGEGVPTLRAVLDALPSSTDVLVELKERGLAREVGRVLADANVEAVVSSFDDRALARAGEVADCPRAYFVRDNLERGIERAVELGCSCVHPNWRLCENRPIERAHDAGLCVNAWTIRHADAASVVRNAHVDGIITDYAKFCGP